VLIESMDVLNDKLSVVPQAKYDADLELAGRTASGDKTAARELVTKLLPQVRRTASFLSPDRATAEDLAQEALLELLKCSGTYRGESSLTFWAARITSRMVFREIRKRRKRNQLDRDRVFPNAQQAFFTAAGPATPAEASVRYALGKLKAAEREVMVLKYVQEFSIEEIAQIRDEPVNTIRTRVMRAKTKLRKTMAKQEEIRNWSLCGAK
jgi:RNA polymerase sigma-70 factor (ECF subfamily)